MIEDLEFDDLDRKFLSFSSAMSDIFYSTYGWLGYRLVAPLDPNKFDNATTKAKEIAIRALILLGAVGGCLVSIPLVLTGVGLGVGSILLRELGYYFQKNGFTEIRGADPKALADGKAKVMVWNLRGYRWLPYENGVVHWRSRIEEISDAIKAEDPNVLVLQEVYDTGLIEALVSRLQGRYAHFYTHLGKGKWGEESGCVVITKNPVSSFRYTDFSHTDSKVSRGFAFLEMKAKPEDLHPCARIIATQLSPGEKAGELRAKQLAEIVDTLAKEKMALPTFFVGSLNVNRDQSEDGLILAKYVNHSYRAEEPTYSPELANQWANIYKGQEGSTDFISLFKREPIDDARTLPVSEKGIRLMNSHLVKAFNETYDTKTALSDHHAVVSTISGLHK